MGKVAIGLLFFICGVGCQQQPLALTAARSNSDKLIVNVAMPITQEIANVLECTGRVEASETVDLHAPVSGLLLSVATYTSDQTNDFREGDLVRKGDILFVVAQNFQLSAQWIAAEGTRFRAKQRIQELHVKESARGKRPDDSETPEMAEIKSALRAVETELEQLKTKLNCVELRSPIQGVAGERRLDPGNLVRASDTQPLTTVLATQPMHVYFEIDEPALLSLLRTGPPSKRRTWNQDVAIGLSDEDDFSHRGQVDFVDNRVSEDTGGTVVRAVFANPSGILHPGLSVRVRVTLSAPRSVLLVQDQAIEVDSQGSYLWLVNSDQLVEQRYIQPGEKKEAWRIVRTQTNGTGQKTFGTDDQYIISPPPGLRAGANVQVRVADDASDSATGDTINTP